MVLAKWMFSGGSILDVEERWAAVGRHRLHYLKAGLKTGQGPTLVLIHGLMGSVGCWAQVLPYLASESAIFAFDALGNGESDYDPNADAGLEATAGRALSFLDAAGIGRADLLGTSHGGSVAMLLAARNPERVRSLILQAPANPFSNIADPLIHFYNTWLGCWFAHRIPALPARLQSLALGRMYGNPSKMDEGTLERYIDTLRGNGTIAHTLKLLRGWHDDMSVLREALPSLRHTPTLLLWGTRDRAVSVESAFRLAEILERAVVSLLPGAGHLPHEEVPEEFALEVNRFLATVVRDEAGFAVPRPQAEKIGYNAA